MCSKNCAKRWLRKGYVPIREPALSVVILSETKKPMHSDAVPRVGWMAKSTQRTHNGRGAILGRTKSVVRISYGNAAILPKSLYDKEVRLAVFFPVSLSAGSRLRRKPKHPGDYSRQRD